MRATLLKIKQLVFAAVCLCLLAAQAYAGPIDIEIHNWGDRKAPVNGETNGASVWAIFPWEMSSEEVTPNDLAKVWKKGWKIGEVFEVKPGKTETIHSAINFDPRRYFNPKSSEAVRFYASKEEAEKMTMNGFSFACKAPNGSNRIRLGVVNTTGYGPDVAPTTKVKVEAEQIKLNNKWINYCEIEEIH